MDTILIRDLRVEVLIGIHKRERHVAQVVSIDLDIGTDAPEQQGSSEDDRNRAYQAHFGQAPCRSPDPKAPSPTELP